MMLTKYKDLTSAQQTEGILEREQQIARQALKDGNNARALTALRRRKYQESLLTKTDNQLETLQNLVRSFGSFGEV